MNINYKPEKSRETDITTKLTYKTALIQFLIAILGAISGMQPLLPLFFKYIPDYTSIRIPDALFPQQVPYSCEIRETTCGGVNYYYYTVKSLEEDITEFRIIAHPILKITDSDNKTKTFYLLNEMNQPEYISDNSVCYLYQENNTRQLIDAINENYENLYGTRPEITEDILFSIIRTNQENPELEFCFLNKGNLKAVNKIEALAIICISENKKIDLLFFNKNIIHSKLKL